MKKLFSLKNKTIVVTGGAGLLGSALSKGCVVHEANVVVADIDIKKGSNLVNELKKETGNSNIVFQKCDITDLEEIQKLIKETLSKFKTIDVLVNNAYPRNRNYGKKFEDVSFEDFCENVDMHLGGYFLMSREISKIMVKQKKGSIINISSIYGIIGPDFSLYVGTDMLGVPAEYSAIKGGIVNLTRYLATYLAKHNIRVNCVSPGGLFNNQPEIFLKRYCEKAPLSRMAYPKDVVGGVIYLASDASSYVTGHNLVIDGGWSAL